MVRRLWLAFSLGRVVTALVLVAVLLAMLQITPHPTQASGIYAQASLGVGIAYLCTTLLAWVWLRQHPPSTAWGLAWLLVLGIEVLCICLIQTLQVLQSGWGSLPYAPLLALPVLATACLGSLRTAWATTAAITLLLLGGHGLALWSGLSGGADSLVQAALICLGYFVIAWFTHHLAHRLAWQEHLARKHHRLARTQAEINGLIITQLSEGVLVVDGRDFAIHQANPAACELLGCPADAPLPSHLNALPLWQPLCQLLQRCQDSGQQGQSDSVLLEPPEQPPIGLYVRVWLHHWSLDDGLPGSQHPFIAQEAPSSAVGTAGVGGRVGGVGGVGAAQAAQEGIFLVFLEDLRELQARLRTEKMAAMGRISAAVAHEIRNPLSAITQANALLQEELHDPAQQRLAQMVADNAQRLAHTVQDVLDIARVQQQSPLPRSAPLPLDTALAHIWHDWQAQHNPNTLGAAASTAEHQHHQHLGLLHLASGAQVAIDAEHLRRIVLNLLDNALRYAQGHDAQRLQLLSGRNPHSGQAWLQVWSQGPEIEAAVQNHLFEPFFSSHSRSSGLGLFICRELCQRHHASIDYQRCQQRLAGGLAWGNGFNVCFAPNRF